jgi:hypothetical protein
VRDTGTGFDPETDHSSSGLWHIRDPVGGLGGTVELARELTPPMPTVVGAVRRLLSNGTLVETATTLLRQVPGVRRPAGLVPEEGATVGRVWASQS